MKKNILLKFTCLVVLLSSCSEQPTCSEKKTKATAQEIAEESILTEIAYDEFINVYVYQKGGNLIENLAKINRTSVDNVLETLKKEIRKEIRTYDSDSTIYTKHITTARKKLNELSPEIVNIRLLKKEDELKKCTCEAELKLKNGNTVNLLYSAQLNENNETFVELQIVK